MRGSSSGPGGEPGPVSLRVSTWLATLLATLAVPPLYSPVGVSLALGTLGVIGLGVGSYRRDRVGINYGLLLQLAAVVVGGFGDVSPGLRLLAALFSVLAWDVARYGLAVEEQLGRKANTARIELVHAGYSFVVGVAGAGLCYGVFLLSTGARSFTALGFLVIGAFALTAALR